MNKISCIPTSKQIGDYFEAYAKLWLAYRGFVIIQSNFNIPKTGEIDKCKLQEGELILAARLPKEKLWVLEVTGKMLSTETLADRLSYAMQDGQDVALVIGGADGVSKAVLAAADFKWSLSDLTLPHPLVKVILMEQLYRAMSIIHHHPYHRGG